MDNGHPERTHRTVLTWALLAGLAVVAACAYWPGLAGDFLFDDFVNLNALGRYGGVRDWNTLLYYLTSGIADPTGRPVSLLTFLLDARDWPAEPWPFKRTNLLIHLLNGVLLASVLVALGHRMSADTRRIHLAAVLATALWLLSPLWVSTVLYVIQRQAMLAALFMLVGIRLWIASRNAFEDGRVGKGVWLAVLAMPVVGLLAGLSKANGFLLPVLLACLELTVLRYRHGKKVPVARGMRNHVRLGFVWVPSLLILGWLLWQGVQTGFDGTLGRPWTLGQRLLSQPRALVEYLHHLWVPGISARGVFADGFVPSRSLLAPWSTLPAMLLVIAALVVGLVQRARWPIISSAILFFFAGHAMESSTLMLEMYFEHRNYLPAVLMFWPLAWWVSGDGKYRRWRLFAIAGYMLIMVLAVVAQASLWGNPLALARAWAAQNPDSPRAQAYAAIQEVAAGMHAEAERRLREGLKGHPDEAQLALNLMDIRCRAGEVFEETIANAAAAINKNNGYMLDANYQWISAVLAGEGACKGLGMGSIERLVDANLDGAAASGASPHEAASRRLRLLGELALLKGHCDQALAAFNERLLVQPRPEFVQSQLVQLTHTCGPEFGLNHLDEYLAMGSPVFTASSPALRLRDWLMESYWQSHWVELNVVLREDVNNSAERAGVKSFGNDE